MTEATSPDPKPKPSADKPAGTTGAATAPGAAPAPEGERTPLDLLREHQSTMLVALVVVLAIVLGVLFQQKKTSDRDARAWAELAELRQKSPEGAAGFEDLAVRHRGTSAEPFIRITWASRLYEAGSRPEVEKARDLLQQVVQEHGGNPFVREMVAPQVKKITDELASPKAKHPATPGAGSLPPPSTEAESPFPR